MSNITHAGIVPLIGGQTIGAELAHGQRPLHLMSWEGFWGNDRHLVNYYENEVPYVVLDNARPEGPKADVVQRRPERCLNIG